MSNAIPGELSRLQDAYDPAIEIGITSSGNVVAVVTPKGTYVVDREELIKVIGAKL